MKADILLPSSNSNKDAPLILIADDDETIRVLLRRVMEQEGYRTAEAVDGEACLASFVELQPQIVLLDIRMPQLDGLSCCSRLKALPGGEHTAVLFVTGVEDKASLERAFELGASDFITKPIHVSVLKQRVRRLLEAGKLVKELRQQIDREQLLRALLLQQTREFSSLDEVLSATVLGVQTFLEADRVLIYKFNDNKDAVAIAEALRSDLPSLQQSIAYSIWFNNRREQHLQGDVTAMSVLSEAQLPLSMLKFLQQYQVQSMLEIPILVEDTLWGLLVVHNCTEPHLWESFETNTLIQLAAQLALTVRFAIVDENLHKLTQRLHILATIDGLTQVANRRRFNDYLQQEWLRGAREQTCLSIVLCNIDAFKQYNTVYGHQAGNECLRRIAVAIGEAIRRPADLVARYSGAEFAVILPNTPIVGAVHVAEEIRAKVAALAISYHEESGVGRCLTLSIGVAGGIPKHDRLPTNLLSLVDQALEQAKLEGRDRIIVSHGDF